MGGASTEIAFSVDPTESGSPYYVTKRLVGKTERLYARSYLCYGYNEALARFLAHLHSNVSIEYLPATKSKKSAVLCAHIIHILHLYVT